MTAFIWLDRLLQKLQGISIMVIWLGVGILAVLASDREPPFKVLAVYPAVAKPGDTVEIVARVHRDTDRGCAAHLSSFILDANGTKFYMGEQDASAELIRRLEVTSPGLLRISFVVPQTADPGLAHHVGVIKYRCNKVHTVWPIEVTSTLPFTIL
jgi:hypothetical protein